MKYIVYLSVPVWLVNVFCLAPAVDNFNDDFIRAKGIAERDILFRTLGEAKNLISDLSYLKADEYYHGGVKHKNLEPHSCLFRDKEEVNEKGFKDKELDKSECLCGHKHEHEHEHEQEYEHLHQGEHLPEKEVHRKDFFRFNLLPKIGGRFSIHRLRHLSGDEEREVVPWLYYSVKLNPHNVEAYVIGAYWVGNRLGRVEEALKFLREGIKYNPDAWQIYSEMGNLYFSKKQDYLQAIRFYSKAEFLMDAENSDQYDKSHLFTFLGAGYEKTGQVDKALEYYRKDITLFPRHEGLIRKVKKLEKNKIYSR